MPVLFLSKPSRQKDWMKMLSLAALLVLGFGLQETQGDDIVDNTLKVLSDLPELGQALETSFFTLLQPALQPLEARAQVNDASGDNSGNFCYGELGCISNSNDFYHPIHRPINFPPETREEVGVNYRIRSKEDTAGVVVPWNNIEKVKQSTFKGSRKTKFIVHGFLNGRDMPYIEEIGHSFLRNYDVNIVWVDWTNGSIALYNRAVANARLVGLEIAYFIGWLQENLGLNPADVHIIGHSLGAHVAGYAGERTPGLGRITGLDPAEPFFQYLPETVRLDPSDANFVDVIHTDSESIFNIGQGFGLRQPVGHLDFYPNDGRQQTGCEPPFAAPLRWLSRGTAFRKVWHAVEDALGCNHKRAVELFVDSIESQCPYMAFLCDSYENYKSGKCASCGIDGTDCAPMGLHADAWLGVGTGKKLVQLFTSTGAGPSFCRYHYKVIVELGELPGTGWDRMGKLYIAFTDGNGQQMSFDLTSGRPKQFTSRGQYTFFLEHKDDFEDVKEAQVKWAMSRRGSRSPHASLSLQNLAFRNVDTYPFRNSIGRSGRSESTFFFCGKSRDPVLITDQETVTLNMTPDCSAS
ncbi:pancreatic triacylglycerol lipase-like isoform X2 [Macrobrachium rosenbergii]|uniref:pancreatic triacylglycerol lipase-like isoform X2 n=1 Tax=Macrobrachium rosenbergii TaxID=79674 RepID=UPI0034D459FE